MSNMETSREALESIEPQITNITDRVYRHILSKGDQGITDDEGFRALGMNPNTYRPCRINLMDKGLVLNTNTKGITESGRKAWKWKAVLESEAVPPNRVKRGNERPCLRLILYLCPKDMTSALKMLEAVCSLS